MTSLWQWFCRTVVQIFYRQFEVAGLENLPHDRGVILCANHVNALADPVIVQASTATMIRPLARSGLFDTPLLGSIMNAIGAVPIYRPGDKSGRVAKNLDSFSRCYELLSENQTLIIFPEGQSHSDPRLHGLKSGAARMALGAIAANGVAPVVVPVGLIFSRKGRFRGDVLVNYGLPVDLSLPDEVQSKSAIRLINERITEGLTNVTINAASWGEVDLVRRLERFFALRHGTHRKANMSQRFQALQRLIDGQQLLQAHEPDRVRSVLNQMRQFERLCQRFGIKDYHLTLKYRPWFVVVQMIRMLLAILIGLPLMVLGIINGAIPFMLTRYLSQRLARGKDQRDSAKIALGGGLFSLFWGLQLGVIHTLWGWLWALGYGVLLLISAAVWLRMRGRYGRIFDDVKVFLLFFRKGELKPYLLAKRHEIEVELASLVRLARRLDRQLARHEQDG